jgi:hypothetical protein
MCIDIKNEDRKQGVYAIYSISKHHILEKQIESIIKKFWFPICVLDPIPE